MCPPGVDQTTRGSQQWYLLAPLLEQQHQFFERCSRRYEPNFEQFSQLKHTTFAFQRLARLDTSSSVGGVGNDISPCPKMLAPIEVLPAELLATVNESLGKEDVLALGACSSTLWVHAMHHIEAENRRTMAPWAGTPLIYTGSYLTVFPPMLYEAFPAVRDAEQEWYRRRQSSSVGLGRPVDGMCPARRWNWNAVSYYESVEGKTCPEQWRKALSDVPNVDQNVRERLTGELDKIFRGPAAGRWFWRNLTLKKYVMLDVVEKGDPGRLRVLISKAPRLSLDMALLAQTRWSVSGWRDCDSKEKPERVWAGHCFDVVKEQPAEEDWEDVTETIKESANMVMRAEDDSEEDDEW